MTPRYYSALTIEHLVVALEAAGFPAQRELLARGLRVPTRPALGQHVPLDPVAEVLALAEHRLGLRWLKRAYDRSRRAPRSPLWLLATQLDLPTLIARLPELQPALTNAWTWRIDADDDGYRSHLVGEPGPGLDALLLFDVADQGRALVSATGGAAPTALYSPLPPALLGHVAPDLPWRHGLWGVALDRAVVEGHHGHPGVVADFLERQVLEAVPKSRPVDAQVVQAIREQLEHAPTAASVARGLGLSRRTLYRRLGDADTTFHALLDGVRREHALEHVHSASVVELTVELGFSEPRSFHRAFVRWTGMGPRAWRSQARATG